ncbi:MAG: SURF1 family protein, partial [Actinobacteria bacterium]|nr:SURF1 family protein [Actinomycetota bacterium]
MGLARILRQPRWIVASVLIVVLAVVFVSLGRWQLERLDEVRAENRLVAARTELPPIDLDELEGPVDAEELEYRRVVTTGVYTSDEEVLQRSRAYRGQNGFHVLTPLVTADGEAVLVRRGWVPYELDTPPVPEAAPPAGEVQVTGFLQRSDEQRDLGPTDPTEGELDVVFRADVPRLDRQVAPELFPMVLALDEQEPPQSGRLPVPAALPDLDEGNHLSYALQWFSFAAIAVIGYAAVLWRRSREEEEE